MKNTLPATDGLRTLAAIGWWLGLAIYGTYYAPDGRYVRVAYHEGEA